MKLPSPVTKPAIQLGFISSSNINLGLFTAIICGYFSFSFSLKPQFIDAFKLSNLRFKSFFFDNFAKIASLNNK
jgi:hypothetical protein